MKKNKFITSLVLFFTLVVLITSCESKARVKTVTIFGCDNSSALRTVLDSGRVDEVQIFCPPNEEKQIDPNIRKYFRMDENDNETCYIGEKNLMTDEILYEEEVRCKDIKISLSEPLGYGGD